jgi:hypothetical protein
LGGGDQKDYGSRPAQAKSQQYSISIKKQGVMVGACDISYTGRIGRKITV